ncbi:MAG: hypothetical protein KY458_03545, partial [Actinobacteria bacterium]|nr:hypothetical protein [Actinomycetota bacterium]
RRPCGRGAWARLRRGRDMRGKTAMKAQHRSRGEQGQGAIAMAAVVVVLVAAVGLLIRTATLANDIDRQSESIAKNGEGINTATKSIIRLDNTNKLGTSILESSTPLSPNLADIVNLAASIDGTATSITDSALTINGTARGINGTAAQILDVARSINRGVEQINRNVDETIKLVQAIRGDTASILGEANEAVKNAACIDAGLTGNNDGHCK